MSSAYVLKSDMECPFQVDAVCLSSRERDWGAVISGICMCTRDRCETVCTLKVKVAYSVIYAPLEHICACSFREDARYPSELPRLSIQPVPQSGEQHIHNAVLPDKGMPIPAWE